MPSIAESMANELETAALNVTRAVGENITELASIKFGERVTADQLDAIREIITASKTHTQISRVWSIAIVKAMHDRECECHSNNLISY